MYKVAYVNSDVDAHWHFGDDFGGLNFRKKCVQKNYKQIACSLLRSRDKIIVSF